MAGEISKVAAHLREVVIIVYNLGSFISANGVNGDTEFGGYEIIE